MRDGVTKIFALFAAGAMLACGCGRKEPVDSGREGAGALRLSMLFPPESPYYLWAERWAGLVERESGGDSRLSLHPRGELLAEEGGDQLGLLGAGTADIAVLRPSELVHLNPRLELVYLPFLFPNLRSAHAVLDSAAGRELLEGLDKGGMIGLGYLSGPFLQLSSTRRVVVPRDLQGMKLRLPPSRNGAVDGEAMKSLGAEAVAVPLGDLRLSLSAGRLDGQVSTLGLYDSLDLANWQTHVTMLNYSFEPMVVVASEKCWQRLSQKQREMLKATFSESAQYQRQLIIEEEGEGKEKLYRKGVSVVELIAAELDLFKKVVEGKYTDMVPSATRPLIVAVNEVIARNKAPYLYRFYDNLKSAFVEAPRYSSDEFPGESLPADGEGSVLAHIGGAYDFDERYGIFCPVPSRIAYDVVVPPNAKLEFGLGMRPGVYGQFPDGVTFAIDIEDEEKGESRRVYEKVHNPYIDEKERGWIDGLLDVDLPAGSKARVIFSTESRAGGGGEEKAYYAAIWSNPVLFEEDRDTYHRNVILISLDALRADTLGCYGNRFDASPTIDLLANAGTIFTNCVSQATWTLPSHISIMTSLYPTAHNMTHDGQTPPKLRPGYLTLAEVMRGQGYNTAAFTESGFVDSLYGYNQGFNRYANISTWGRQKRELAEDAQVSPLAFKDNVDLEAVFERGVAQKHLDLLRAVHVTFARSQEWIRKNKGRRFFCFIHTYETHVPYFPNPYVRLFDPNYNGIIPDVMDFKKGDEFDLGVVNGTLKLTKEDLNHTWALYSAQLRFTDDFMSQLIQTLKDAGIDDNTLIVLTSDHGEKIYKHNFFINHGGPPHEGVIMVPLVVNCRSIVPPGKIVSAQTASIDIFPTIADFAGAPKDPVLEGQSLYPCIVLGSRLEEARPVYTWGADDETGLRIKGKKLIYTPQSRKRELYDLTKDPGELENLMGASGEAQLYDKMVQGYIRRQANGYYLVFTGDGLEHTFEGGLTVVGGDFTRVCFDGVEGRVAKRAVEGASPSPTIVFKTKVSEPQTHMINFDVSPEGARMVLELKVDGVRNPSVVFLVMGWGSKHPEKLPCDIDASVQSKLDPYSLTASKKLGCYVLNVGIPYLVDKDKHEGLRVSSTEEVRLEDRAVDVQAEEDKERMEKMKERLKALGYAE